MQGQSGRQRFLGWKLPQASRCSCSLSPACSWQLQSTLSGDSHGHISLSLWLPSPAPQTPGKGRTAHKSRATKRKRQLGRGQGAWALAPSCHHMHFWPVLVPLRVTDSCHKGAILGPSPFYDRNAAEAAPFAYQ